ncbi:MAG: 2,3-diphosphoglycerate-dependent phosphoglycerate mutase [Pleomorphochaeta sp.]
MSYKLVILRHGESIWNLENLFTGWTDVDLSENGVVEAKQAGKILSEKGFEFDICYTSYLKRAINTLNFVLQEMDREWLPVIKSWKLNERHYGSLQGKNKAETAKIFGEDQVKIWRRSFDIKPPELAEDDERNPAFQKMYKNVSKAELPLAESLKDTIARVIPYFEKEIKPKLESGQNILITAHGNSLRALVMYLEHISEKDILELNIPTGVPLVYYLNEDLSVISKEYLGDKDLIDKKINKVAQQGSNK